MRGKKKGAKKEAIYRFYKHLDPFDLWQNCCTDTMQLKGFQRRGDKLNVKTENKNNLKASERMRKHWRRFNDYDTGWLSGTDSMGSLSSSGCDWDAVSFAFLNVLELLANSSQFMSFMPEVLLHNETIHEGPQILMRTNISI